MTGFSSARRAGLHVEERLFCRSSLEKGRIIMKKYLILFSALVMLPLTTSLATNNPAIFKGGNADGYDESFLEQLPRNISRFYGGNADGYTDMTSNVPVKVSPQGTVILISAVKAAPDYPRNLSVSGGRGCAEPVMAFGQRGEKTCCFPLFASANRNFFHFLSFHLFQIYLGYLSYF